MPFSFACHLGCYPQGGVSSHYSPGEQKVGLGNGAAEGQNICAGNHAVSYLSMMEHRPPTGDPPHHLDSRYSTVMAVYCLRASLGIAEREGGGRPLIEADGGKKRGFLSPLAREKKRFIYGHVEEAIGGFIYQQSSHAEKGFCGGV